jgi:hypothetical protein
MGRKNTMSTIKRAIEIAEAAHKGQKDKAGANYILHPLRVMERGKSEVEKICGVLHDVVEDSEWTFEMLEKEGFSDEVISVLRCVTMKSEEDYETFVNRIAQNPIAVEVKINDFALLFVFCPNPPQANRPYLREQTSNANHWRRRMQTRAQTIQPCSM